MTPEPSHGDAEVVFDGLSQAELQLLAECCQIGVGAEEHSVFLYSGVTVVPLMDVTVQFLTEIGACSLLTPWHSPAGCILSFGKLQFKKHRCHVLEGEKKAL